MVQVFGPITLGLTAASLVASIIGVWISIRLARRAGVLDHPSDRSSHTVPTPRMGGIPMVAAALLAFGCWSFLAVGEVFSMRELSFAILFAFSMSVLGFWDDLSSLSPLARFTLQLFGAILLLWLLAELFSKVSLEGVDLPQFAWIIIGSFWIVWMVNLYNFMDGIDGLAGGEAVVASSFFFLVFIRYGESGWAVSNLFVAAASIGFLVHNWPPARVFMGDAGSAFLGAFYGVQSVVAAITTPVPLLVLVLPFSNFILDSTCTLICRIWNGEKWYRPHKSHYYQRLIGLGMTHHTVTTLELISACISCAAAWIYLVSGQTGRIVVTFTILSGFLFCGAWVSQKTQGFKQHPPQ